MTSSRHLDSISTINYQYQTFDLRNLAEPNFLEQNPMLSTDIPPGVKGYDMGIAGDTIPYAISNDGIISIVLLGCFIFTFIATARSRQLINREFKNFFANNHNGETTSETSGELRYQIVMVFIGILLLAFSSYMYATDAISPAYLVKSHYMLIGMLFGLFFLYFLVCWLSMTIVNAVFFDSKKNVQWIQVKLFLTAIASALLLPIVLLQVYFDFSAVNALLCFISILILDKILTFYKCWTIFFRQKGGILQTFLYFCALEMTPLLAFGGIWLLMIDNLKINF